MSRRFQKDPRAQLKFILIGTLLSVGIFIAWGQLEKYGLVEPAFGVPLNTEQVIVQTLGGEQLAFQVEIADTDVKRQRGLMFRKSMGQNAGMLFLFEKNEPVSFWMKKPTCFTRCLNSSVGQINR